MSQPNVTDTEILITPASSVANLAHMGNSGNSGVAASNLNAAKRLSSSNNSSSQENSSLTSLNSAHNMYATTPGQEITLQHQTHRHHQVAASLANNSFTDSMSKYLQINKYQTFDFELNNTKSSLDHILDQFDASVMSTTQNSEMNTTLTANTAQAWVMANILIRNCNVNVSIHFLRPNF